VSGMLPAGPEHNTRSGPAGAGVGAGACAKAREAPAKVSAPSVDSNATVRITLRRDKFDCITFSLKTCSFQSR
jgi:hypothetical protein